MCGINGIISRKNIADIQVRISSMNDSLFHRGPDAGNTVIVERERVALGHRRLSIIDLNERSNQPMVSNSKKWVLVYNGEIYNYKELKKETVYHYTTESDTEVILAFLEEYGIEELLKRCNGMFAFAAYNIEEQCTYICRDRMGIKPLYYYLDDDYLVFSSEIKGILHSGLVEAVLDEESIDDYLGYRYVREPFTFFKDIRQVEAGTFITINAQSDCVIKRYWDVPTEFNVEENYDEEKICQEFRAKLEDAIMKRTIADVPLGTYLSGGVDSSLLTAVVAQNANKRLNTYTIGFDELNEFEYSDMVAEKYHTQHHKIRITQEDYADELRNVISYKDAPLGVPNEIPLAVMSRELKKDITVVLSGEGADELLGGYGRIFRAPFEYGNHENGMAFYDFFIGQYEYVPRKIRDQFLNVSKNRRQVYDNAIRKMFSDNRNEYNVFHFFHKYHVKGLLQRVDTTTMLASVEARVPFLDHELIEYSYKKVPYSMKLRWNSDVEMEKARSASAKEYSEKYDTPKYLLRKVARDYIPEEVITRKKVGFPVPLDQWNTYILQTAEKELKKATWLKKDTVDSLIQQCQKSGIGNQLIWMFLNVQIFVDMYFNKEWRY